MYRIEDKNSAVREVQRYILIIGEVDNELPKIPVDGFYGEETRLAVSDFQRSRGIADTGSVDKETFDLLFFEADEIQKERKRRQSVINYESFPLKLGDSGSDVSNLNTVLRELGEYYKNINPLPVGGFFSRNTESAVKVMQYHLRQTEEGVVSIELYNRLREEIAARGIFKDS